METLSDVQKKFWQKIPQELAAGFHVWTYSLTLSLMCGFIAHSIVLGIFCFSTGFLVQCLHARFMPEHRHLAWAHSLALCIGATGMLYAASWLQFHNILILQLIGLCMVEFGIHSYVHEHDHGEKIGYFFLVLLGMGLLFCIAVSFEILVRL